MSNYNAADFDPWVSNIRGLGTALARLPAMRAEAQERQQRTRLIQAQTETEGAQAQNYRASAGKLDAETTDIKGETESGNRLSSALKKVSTNPNDTDAAGDAISEFGHYFKKNPEQAAKGMGDLLSHVMAMRGDTNFAEQGSLQGNAASIANNLENNKRVMETPMVVPDNSVAIDKTTGQPVATSPQKLSMGQRLFSAGNDGVTLDTKPTVEGGPTPPKSSAATQERNKFIADVLKTESDPLKQQEKIRRYDKQTGYKPVIDISAAVTPAPPTSTPASVGAPTQPGGTTQPPGPDVAGELSAARQAIQGGKDATAVKVRFKQRTGHDFDAAVAAFGNP